MILTCPSCSVRYLVDARALGTKGRMVRCARCGHTWHQAQSEESAAAAAPTASEPEPEEKASAPAESETPSRRAEPPPLAAERRIQLPALARRRRRPGLALAWALTIVAILAGLGYTAVAERQRIVALVPDSARLYARLGLAPQPGDAGLAFSNIATSHEMQNGLPALVVSGDVTNHSSAARDVPKLLVILLDKSGHDLQTSTIDINAHQLAPGATVPFRTSILQPAEATEEVKVTFAGGKPG